jgi:signal transduction histidine kinase
MQNHLFRLVQEALQNAAKHSNCERIVVALRYGDSVLKLRIKDDGIGFTPEDRSTASTGSGIMNMKERTRFLGAELTIDSVPGGGTEVCVRVPWSTTE